MVNILDFALWGDILPHDVIKVDVIISKVRQYQHAKACQYRDIYTLVTQLLSHIFYHLIFIAI